MTEKKIISYRESCRISKVYPEQKQSLRIVSLALSDRLRLKAEQIKARAIYGSLEQNIEQFTSLCVKPTFYHIVFLELPGCGYVKNGQIFIRTDLDHHYPQLTAEHEAVEMALVHKKQEVVRLFSQLRLEQFSDDKYHPEDEKAHWVAKYFEFLDAKRQGFLEEQCADASARRLNQLKKYNPLWESDGSYEILQRISDIEKHIVNILP